MPAFWASAVYWENLAMPAGLTVEVAGRDEYEGPYWTKPYFNEKNHLSLAIPSHP